MKKTLVALAVAAMAVSSANAAVVYDKDGTKVELSGSLRLMLGKFGDEQRGDLRNNKSRLILDASHNLGNGLSALATLELRFQGDTEGTSDTTNSFGNPNTTRLFAGFNYDNVGTLTFGKQFTNSDDIELADYSYTLGGNNNLTTDADKSIKFRSAEWSGFSFGLDYNFGQSNKNAIEAGKLKYGYGVAAFYTRELAQDLTLNFNAGYNIDKFDRGGNVDPTSKGSEKQSWRTVAELVYGPASFAAEYGESKLKIENQNFAKAKFIELGARYQVIEPSAIYLQWQRNELKALAEATVTSQHDTSLDIAVDQGDKAVQNVYLAGVDYEFNKNVVTYIEYAHVRTAFDKAAKEKENKYGVGLRVHF